MLTKSEIYKIIAECTGVSSKLVKACFQVYGDLVKKEIKTEGQVRLPDLGTFRVTIGRERISVDPQTGAQTRIPPKPKVKFRASKPLKEATATIKWKYVSEDDELLQPKRKPSGFFKNRDNNED
ncbi:HU family DNA-binding protein [Mycoplasma bradburyae]|uniref:Viral histone-like protein n=1 Tax=Mycoplasma bradburyae TaxID=2963128 RepID=A0AAW6HSM2_9MOLU|nr:HU family DNA-binding protein [Mycoplasma bradburyae]MDC4163615.1 HU family DNA-binding protein [Mycoplasma bradburyae]MDC4182212.1 HU family DNA-binding protein [Mycoplasma bradburyae]MDC4182981.1 HU family DNA-binding protein [Mycoplasma bradburyae]MDC4183718.1 HU family DNA-binding protein [Mycoplasma bradburyae]MDC4184398.1 HU family DNA-binding protein [Mycoplasma bradburyae]